MKPLCPQCKAPAVRSKINARTLRVKCTKCSWITHKTYVGKGAFG